MSTTVRWGVLGTAKIAVDRVIPALHNVPEATLYAVASRDAARARQFAERSGASVSYGSYRDLIEDDRVDAIYVPLPNALHAQWAHLALAAGKPVLCEKPLTTSAAATAELAGFAETKDVLLAEGFMYRHHPTTARIAGLVASGAIGTPLVARGALSFPMTDPAGIRASPALGGGALFDLGCYVVDALCRLYGGRAGQAAGYRLLGNTGADAHVAAVLSFPGGRLGVLDCSFRLPWLESVFEIRGDAGSIRAPHAFNPGRSASTVTLLQPGGKSTQFDVPGCDMFATMFGAFSRAVLGAEPYPFPARLSVDAAHTTALLSALPASRG